MNTNHQKDISHLLCMIFDRVQQAVKELSSWKLAICEDDGDARPSKHSIRQTKGAQVEPGCL